MTEQVFYDTTPVDEGQLPEASKPGELAIGRFSEVDLVAFSRSLARPKWDSIIETPAFTLVVRLTEKNQGAIVVIPDGGGKTTLLDFLVDNAADSWQSVEYCPDAESLTKELWEWERCPSPTFSEFRDRARNGIFNKMWGREGLSCFYCKRQCLLVKRKAGFLVLPPDDEDMQIGLCQNAPDDCPLIKRQALGNLSQLDVNLVLEMPSNHSNEYIALLRKVPGKLILLSPPEAVKTLHQALSLPVSIPPPPPPSLLLEIYRQRLKDADLIVSPLHPSALVLLAIISRGNPGRFLGLVGQVIDQLKLTEVTETVGADYIGRQIHLLGEIDDELMLEMALSEFSGQKVSPSQLCYFIRETFHRRIKPELVGKELHRRGFRGRRRGQGVYYDIPGELTPGSPPLKLKQG